MDKQEIVTKAEMLIRSPVAKVFEAFVEPAITSKFWFGRGSGKLEAGKTVRLPGQPKAFRLFLQARKRCLSTTCY
jgi:uncharacterized protein YndB with AHSA1/START domain